MRAQVGDRLRIRGRGVGKPDRVGQIVEVRGSEGEAPFGVRWDGKDHGFLVFPGLDAVVEHGGARSDDDDQGGPELVEDRAFGPGGAMPALRTVETWQFSRRSSPQSGSWRALPMSLRGCGRTTTIL